MSAILTANNLIRQYKVGGDYINAVNGINLEIKKGELTILRGRSGSGKTTLINLLSTLDSPTSGTIFYGDRELSAFNERQKNEFRRKEIGIIFQAVALISKMNALENVEFGLRIAGKARKGRIDIAKHYLHLLGLGKRISHMPGELSGGEQQRIAIARALCYKPKIIFADEPTAELDTATGLHVMKVFKELIRDEGMSVIMTTHDPNMIEIADTVYTLSDGEIVNE